MLTKSNTMMLMMFLELTFEKKRCSWIQGKGNMNKVDKPTFHTIIGVRYKKTKQNKKQRQKQWKEYKSPSEELKSSLVWVLDDFLHNQQEFQ